MMIEIAPGITADPERAFGRPVIAGTRVTAAEVLGSRSMASFFGPV